MAIVLRNALFVDIDPISVASGELRIADGLIAERGETVAQRVGDEVVDCGGCVVMPGMVNGHTHLYSALAVGRPPPAPAARRLRGRFPFVWWGLGAAAVTHRPCVAALSQRMLDEGREFCCLCTDLSKRTSNDIYLSIGYQPVCDSDDYLFE